jgi:hypothetical protein
MEKENSKSIAYIDILTNIVGEQRNMTDEELAIYRKILYQGAEHHPFSDHHPLSDKEKFLVGEIPIIFKIKILLKNYKDFIRKL